MTEQHELVARLASLRTDLVQRAERGENVSDMHRVYKAVAECVVRGDLETAKWILASERMAAPARREGKVIPFEIVRAPERRQRGCAH